MSHWLNNWITAGHIQQIPREPLPSHVFHCYPRSLLATGEDQLQMAWNTSLRKERKAPAPIGISHTEGRHLTSGFCNLSDVWCYIWQKKRPRSDVIHYCCEGGSIYLRVWLSLLQHHTFLSLPFVKHWEPQQCVFLLHEKLKLWQSIRGVRRMQPYGSPTVFWRAHCCHHTSATLGIALLEKTSAASWGCQQWSCCLSHCLSAKSTTSVSAVVIQQRQATATEAAA